MPQGDERLLAFRIYRYRDEAAFNVLYLRYSDLIRRFLAAKLPRREDADELTSEVFLHAWEYTTANLIDHPKALYFKIAKNMIADFYRKRSRRPEAVLTPELERDLASPGSLAEDTEARERAEKLLAKIDQLKEEYRDVLILHYIDERAVSEIANMLDKTPNNVRVLLFRAKAALRKVTNLSDEIWRA